MMVDKVQRLPMKWPHREKHFMVSDCGYKIARYRVGEQVFYRPSLGGSFISAPQSDLNEAKGICDEHARSNADD